MDSENAVNRLTKIYSNTTHCLRNLIRSLDSNVKVSSEEHIRRNYIIGLLKVLASILLPCTYLEGYYISQYRSMFENNPCRVYTNCILAARNLDI